MSCPHAETTALLAVFGESPAEFEIHLQNCDECLEVVQSHTQTLSVLEPVLSSAPTGRPEVQPKPQSWRPPTVVFLLAAAVLLVIQLQKPAVDSGRLEIDSPIHTATSFNEPNPFEGLLDSELESLEIELALLNLE
ncbi:MAG: hypothetical protein ACPGTU_01930 [Myxococcota bacterium]